MGTAHQRIETIGFVPFRPITVYLKSSETMSDMSVKEVPGMRPQRCTIRGYKKTIGLMMTNRFWDPGHLFRLLTSF